MDVTDDRVISRTASKLANATEALVRSLAARSPYMPQDGLETESLLLTPWIQINRPNLAQSYNAYLEWVSVEASRLYRQRSSELPSENWLTEHLFFKGQCFKFTVFLRQLAAHIDEQRREPGPDPLTPPSSTNTTVGGGRAKKKTAGRPPLSAKEQKSAKKFCEGLNESRLSCPAYCRKNGIDPQQGNRMRDYEYRRQKRQRDALKTK